VKLTIIAKCFISTTYPIKTEEFHRIIIPAKAPTDGAYTKVSKRFGQNFLIKRQSNFSHLVS
jgi:hypothetical protein